MDKEITIRDVELSEKRLSVLCRLSSSILAVFASVIMLPFFLSPFVLFGAVLSVGPFSYSGSPLAFIILLIQSLILSSSLWLLRYTFVDISRKRPFCPDQSKRLFMVGILMMSYTFIEMIPYETASLHFSLGVFYVGLELFKPTPTAINLGTLVCSISFLTISAVFKYGLLLRCISDDTI